MKRRSKLLNTQTRKSSRQIASKARSTKEHSPTIIGLKREIDRLTRELGEAIEQQTATAEVLESINRSSFDLSAVVQMMVSTARRLCNAGPAGIFLLEGDIYKYWTGLNLSEVWREHERQAAIRAGRGTLVGRAAMEKRVVQIFDALEDREYEDKEAARVENLHSMLGVPLMRDEEVIGVFALARNHVEPFAESQIRLVSTFADQAVIAIENTRLLNELQARTNDLSESLEQQTATSEVLQVISSSTGDVAPVFQKLLENATRVCSAEFGTMNLVEDGQVRNVALHNVPPAFASARANRLFQPHPESVLSLSIRSKQVVQIDDLRTSPAYLERYPSIVEMADVGGARTLVAVPMLRDDELIGTIVIYRQEIRPFTDKQIELLKNFASQAVIAIENTRLLKELRERTDQVAELNRGLEARVAEQVEELGRVGRLKRFLAPQLAELIVSQGDEKILESHRREIVVVFCDLRGYTAFTETAEPEEVLDFLRKYHGALGPLVSQFEGTLDQFSGDGIMVFFNDPVPIPDPAERAVNMAVAMREAASSLTAAWRERGRELGFGAGIAQGYATLGQIGFSERSGYTAIGTVCNVAARLCGEAKDGQILLSQRVNVALKGSVATEQVGALALKGLTQPVVTYNVPLTASQPALRVIDGGNH
jgi:class 3 adenylate cyclase/putative methionine-R-sulfoxide reductase with GAF domain